VTTNNTTKLSFIDAPLAQQPSIDDDDGEWGVRRPLGAFGFSCCFDLSLI